MRIIPLHNHVNHKHLLPYKFRNLHNLRNQILKLYYRITPLYISRSNFWEQSRFSEKQLKEQGLELWWHATLPFKLAWLKKPLSVGNWSTSLPLSNNSSRPIVLRNMLKIPRSRDLCLCSAICPRCNAQPSVPLVVSKLTMAIVSSRTAFKQLPYLPLTSAALLLRLM